MFESVSEYRTTSLALASAILASQRSSLIGINWLNNKAEFVFDLDLTLVEQISRDFWEHSYPVDSLTYFESMKYLKNRLYEEKR